MNEAQISAQQDFESRPLGCRVGCDSLSRRRATKSSRRPGAIGFRCHPPISQEHNAGCKGA